MPRPVPVEDVLAAARYSLYHDVSNALAASVSNANPRRRLGALKSWLYALQHALPQLDGGAAAAGMGELLAGLHAFGDSLPTQDEWMQMLAHCGFPDAVRRHSHVL